MVQKQGVYHLPAETKEHAEHELAPTSVLDAPSFLKQATAPPINPNEKKRLAKSEVLSGGFIHVT